MSESNLGGSTADVNASGVDGETESLVDQSKDKVALETHRRLLGQYKNAQQKQKELEDKVNQFEANKRELEEKALQEKGEWQKLIELKVNQLAEMKQKLAEKEQGEQHLKKTLFDAAKLQAVKERLPGQLVNPQYAGFIDVDKVVINPETNEIDEDSINTVVDEFVRSHSALLKSDTIRLPNGGAKPSTKLTYEDWLKLPSAKEKRLRMKDVDGYKSR